MDGLSVMLPSPSLSSTMTQRIDIPNISFSSDSPTVTMNFIMPNGILITQNQVPVDASLAEIKLDLWEKARDYPLYGLLQDMNSYHFYCTGRVTGMPGQGTNSGELLDEERTLGEINPILNFLQVVKRKGNETEKKLDKDVSHLIGKNLGEFDALKNPEINEFRWKMKTLCDEVCKERSEFSWNRKVQYKYPCSVDHSEEMPNYLKQKFPPDDWTMLVSVRFTFAVRSVESTFKLRVQAFDPPNTIMELALNKFNFFDHKKQMPQVFDKNKYILKIVGHEEYLVEEVPIYRYICFQEHIATNVHEPFDLLVVERNSINVENFQKESTTELEPPDATLSVRNSFSSTLTLNKKKSLNVVSSWTISEPFKVDLGKISYLNLVGQDDSYVFVVGGLYHGTLSLCERMQTSSLKVVNNSVEIGSSLVFDINVWDLPRSARLCLAIREEPSQPKQGKKSGDTNQFSDDSRGIAWVNVSVFDYRRSLRRGAMTLYCWSVHDNDEVPKPLGTVVSNPEHGSAIAITVTFPRYHPSCDLMYPSQSTLKDMAKSQPNEHVQPTPSDDEFLEKIASRDSQMEIHEQDKKRLWALRWYCAKKVSHILPRLLQCIEWNTREQVNIGCRSAVCVLFFTDMSINIFYQGFQSV